MKKGDLILVKYKLDVIGWLIRRFTKFHFNHIALCINDKGVIIESNRQGILPNHISKYKNIFLYKTKILRVKVDEKIIDELILEALLQVKKYPIIAHILSFIYIGLGLNVELPKPTCSGFIATLFSQFGVQFNKKVDPSLITPLDIYKSRRTYEL